MMAGFIKCLRIVSIGLVCCLLLTTVLGCAEVAEPPGKPELSASLVISPMSGKAKAPMTITGAGFQPGERIDIVLEAAHGYRIGLGTQEVEGIVANEFGGFSVVSNIPAPLSGAPGVYTVKAVGDKGSAAVFPLEIVE